jgi:hypothetical protein
MPQLSTVLFTRNPTRPSSLYHAEQETVACWTDKKSLAENDRLEAGLVGRRGDDPYSVSCAVKTTTLNEAIYGEKNYTDAQHAEFFREGDNGSSYRQAA